MGLPITVLGKLSDSVMFSGLSMLQDDQKRLRRALLSAIYHIGLLVVPGSAFMVIWANEITVLFLGEKYVDAVPIVQILFVSVAFRSIIKVGDSMVRALDRVYTASLIKLLFLVLVGLGTYFGLSAGLKGVAWSIVVAVLVQFVLMMRLSLSLVGLSFGRMMRKLVPAAIVTLVVVIASLIAQKMLSGFEELRLMRLIMAIVINGGSLFVVAWFMPLFFRQGEDNVLQTVARKLPVEALRRRWDSNV
jgi:PST family polysaccharide transporter